MLAPAQVDVPERCGRWRCREVYELCHPGFQGRCTAPVVVDTKARRLVSNESSEIVRNLNTVQLPGASDVDLVPRYLEADIDQLNDLVYNQVCILPSPSFSTTCSRQACKLAPMSAAAACTSAL